MHRFWRTANERRFREISCGGKTIRHKRVIQIRREFQPRRQLVVLWACKFEFDEGVLNWVNFGLRNFCFLGKN
jgi:hypothetical protein